jgi:hypothetical protein
MSFGNNRVEVAPSVEGQHTPEAYKEVLAHVSASRELMVQARDEARASRELFAEALAEIRTLAIRHVEALTDGGARADMGVLQELIAEILAAIRSFEFVSSPGSAAAGKQDALSDVHTEIRASRDLIAQVLTEVRASADYSPTIPDTALQEAIAQARADIRLLQDMITSLREQLGHNGARRLPDWLRRSSLAGLFGKENFTKALGLGQVASTPV